MERIYPLPLRMAIKVNVPGFGECAVETEGTDGDTILVSSVCVVETGEVVTDRVFKSGVIYETEPEIRNALWDDQIGDKIDNIL